MPRIRPARTGAVEVKPPIPRTTCGLNLRKIPRQSDRLSLKRLTKARIAGEKGDGSPTVGSFSKRNSDPPLERERIDFLFGNEEQHLVPAFAQHFRHGETWEEMPARSSTCDHGVHEDVES